MSIVATPEVAAGARLWRTAGGYRLTIVVKATFSPAHQRPMEVVAPDPIVVDDAHVENDDSRSVLVASDLAPYLPRGEVIFVGRAWSAQGAVPAVSVRLAVYGARPLVEKTLHVVGPRLLGEGGAGAPAPFVDLPITYEHALRGPIDENPAGIVPVAGSAMPTILDPDDAGSPAGFGPISGRWAGRRRLLRGLDPTLLDTAIPDLPDAFAWSYFHAAPPDQRCTFFAGDEWVVLDNLWRGLARLESRLPGVRGGARVYDGSQHVDVPLLADTLFIDGNREVCSLIWRGNVSISDPARLGAMEVLAGLETPGRPIPWPAEAPSASARTPEPAPPAEAPWSQPDPARAEGAGASSEEGQLPTHTRASNASGQHEAVPGHSSRPGGVRHGSGQHQAVPAQQPYPQHPSGQHQAVTAQQPYPQQQGSQHASGQHQAVSSPQQPYPGSPSGQYQSGGADRVRQPTPPPGDRPRMPTPTPGSHGGRAPTTPPSRPRHPTPAPMPPVADEPEAEDDGGHTVMRPVDARLLAELASLDGPTTVGRHQEAAAAQRPERPTPPPPSQEERSESTALFNLAANNTLMQIARGEAQSPVSQAQAETTRRPTAEHELVDEQTFVHDEAELQRLLEDSGSNSAQPLDDEGPSTRNETARALPAAPGAEFSDAAPPTMATPLPLPPMPPDASRRALRMTSRGLGPVHVLEAAAVDPGTALPAPADAPEQAPSQGAGSLDATRPGSSTLKQALRDEMLRRLASGESLADAQLEGADLRDLDLSGRVFANAVLRGARFDRSRLDGADLSGAKLDGAYLEGVSLTGARLIGASLEGANLDGASLLSAALDDANLSKASMAGTLMVDATATRANFRETELRDARFDRSRLGGADFERARLTNASFLACDLTEASFFEAVGMSASFVEANMTGARFDLSHFALARFARAIASDTLWNEAVLDGASCEAANLAGATFGKASCQGSVFSSADLSEARFPRAKLDGATFTGADLSNAMFDSPGGPPTGPNSATGT